jgi:8-oxo-dGTP pyrophosphatase MutT (NUDIX family)
MAATPVLDAKWLAALRASASAPPLRPRVPLWAGQSVIGSVEPDFLHQIALQPLSDGRKQLLKEEHPKLLGWRLMGDVTISLNQLAGALRTAGLAGAWRDEQVAVHDQFDHRKGTVERAAVRPLGIATLAVHLVGMAPDGRFWVQQRAADKPQSPGKWDTLVGGMVSAGDTVDSALARETMEEAGLKLAGFRQLRRGGRLATRRPASPDGAGYVVEDIEWFSSTVPEAMLPANQDGEVAQFRLMSQQELVEAMQRGDFTLEAALVLADAICGPSTPQAAPPPGGA